MADRKLFCLIKQTDLPESHAGSDAALQKLVDYRCGCGWPDQPCLEMYPEMRSPPIVAVRTWTTVPARLLPWNQRRNPIRRRR